MSSKKAETAEERLARYVERLEGLYADAETITASDLAGAVERSGKVVRARLREMAYRDADAKFSRHAVPFDVAAEIAEHYATAKRVS